METFSLWNMRGDGDTSVSLFVTAINVQELGSGTEDFFRTVLRDVGLEAEPSAWHVSTPFATSYLAAEETADWRDRWWLTWDVEISVDTSATDKLLEHVVDTFAFDESWTGVESSPEAFVVIASFGRGGPEVDIKERVRDVQYAKKRALQRRFPEASEELIRDAVQVFRSSSGSRVRAIASREGRVNQVRIEVGDASVEATASAADVVERLVQTLGACTRLPAVS